MLHDAEDAEADAITLVRHPDVLDHRIQSDLPDDAG
jgi:hypothetical protein